MRRNFDTSQYEHLNGSVCNAFNRGGIGPEKARKFKDNPEAQEFLKWFGGSVVCNRTGYPVIQYHGMRTDLGETSNFIPYSHFGNLNVGNAFSGFIRREPKRIATQRGGVVYPVALNIKNPLGLPDIKSHSIWQIADYLRNFEVITEDEHRWINAGRKLKGKHPVCRQAKHRRYLAKEYPAMSFIQYKLETGSEHFHMADRITKLLAKKGYDGIAYKNMYEFPGSTSWIVFNPETQIRSAFDVARLGIPCSRGRDLEMNNKEDISFPRIDAYVDNGLELDDETFSKYYERKFSI